MGCFRGAPKGSCVGCDPCFILYFISGNVDLVFRIRWGGEESRELLRNGVFKFASLLGVPKGPTLLENLRILGDW